ncbi:MAG: hypothetical protein ABI837_03515 [Acidobacteriota bacterium]
MNRWQVLYLNASLGITTLTGLIFAVMKYGLTSDDPFAVVNHPLQPVMLSWHVVLAPLLVFGFGWIFADHIWPRFRQQTPAKRKSGVSSMAMIVPMTFSGYLLQVSVNETLRHAMAVTHWITSALFVIAYAVHLAIGKAQRAGEA